MKLELTTEQAREVTLAYIQEQQYNEEAMREVGLAIFSGLCFAPWRWDLLLYDLVKFCSKVYNTPVDRIVEDWK